MSDSEYPEPTAGALIQDPEGRILLLRSHKFNDLYTIPGGHIELGETAEEALRREVKEETGLEVYDIAFLMYQDFVFDEAFWKRKHFVFLDFTCKTDCTIVQLNDEAQDYQWTTPADALNLPVETYTLRAIEAFMTSRGSNGK